MDFTFPSQETRKRTVYSILDLQLSQITHPLHWRNDFGDPNAEVLVDDHDLAFSNQFVNDQDIHRFTGKLVQLDDRAFANPQDLPNQLAGSAQLYGQLHVDIHEQPDVPLFPRGAGALQIGKLHRLDVRGSLTGTRSQTLRSPEGLPEGLSYTRLGSRRLGRPAAAAGGG